MSCRLTLKTRQKLFLAGLFLILSTASCTSVRTGERNGQSLEHFLQIENRRSVLSYDWIKILKTRRDKNGVVVSEDILFERENCSFSQNSPDCVTFFVSTGNSEYRTRKAFHLERGKRLFPPSAKKILRWVKRVNNIATVVGLAWDGWVYVENTVSRKACRFRIYYSKNGKVIKIELI